MVEVAGMRERANLLGDIDRQIVGLNAVFDEQHAPLKLPCVGVQTQVHRELIGTQVAAIADHDADVDFGVFVHPRAQRRTHERPNRVLGDDRVLVRERQRQQLRHSLRFLRATDAVRRELPKLDRVGVVRILWQHEMAHAVLTRSLANAPCLQNPTITSTQKMPTRAGSSPMTSSSDAEGSASYQA
jgi:hypothetical protein